MYFDMTVSRDGSADTRETLSCRGVHSINQRSRGGGVVLHIVSTHHLRQRLLTPDTRLTLSGGSSALARTCSIP